MSSRHSKPIGERFFGFLFKCSLCNKFACPLDGGVLAVPGWGSGSGFRTRALSAAGDPREPDVYEVTLGPGWVEPAAAHAADTFEHIVVVRGTLAIEVGQSGATLAPGDTVFFRADRPHMYQNPGVTETILHLTMVYAGDWIDTAD